MSRSVNKLEESVGRDKVMLSKGSSVEFWTTRCCVFIEKDHGKNPKG